MRWALLLIVIAACGRKGAPDPAWPESAGHVAPETWEEDGGESLEPRGSTMVEDSEDDGGETIDPEPQTAVVEEQPGDALPEREDEMIIDDTEDQAPPPEM